MTQPELIHALLIKLYLASFFLRKKELRIKILHAHKMDEKKTKNNLIDHDFFTRRKLTRNEVNKFFNYKVY